MSKNELKLRYLILTSIVNIAVGPTLISLFGLPSLLLTGILLGVLGKKIDNTMKKIGEDRVYEDYDNVIEFNLGELSRKIDNKEKKFRKDWAKICAKFVVFGVIISCLFINNAPLAGALYMLLGWLNFEKIYDHVNEMIEINVLKSYKKSYENLCSEKDINLGKDDIIIFGDEEKVSKKYSKTEYTSYNFAPSRNNDNYDFSNMGYSNKSQNERSLNCKRRRLSRKIY